MEIPPAGDVDPYEERFEALFEFTEHDYDPRWDYEEQLRLDLLEHPLQQLAQRRLDALASLDLTPFERARVFPADLSSRGPGALALYCSGTYNEPVFLIDLAAHQQLSEDPELAEFGTPIDVLDQIRRSMDHEVQHAVQESEWEGEGEWSDEDDAEEALFPLEIPGFERS